MGKGLVIVPISLILTILFLSSQHDSKLVGKWQSRCGIDETYQVDGCFDHTPYTYEFYSDGTLKKHFFGDEVGVPFSKGTWSSWFGVVTINLKGTSVPLSPLKLRGSIEEKYTFEVKDDINIVKKYTFDTTLNMTLIGYKRKDKNGHSIVEKIDQSNNGGSQVFYKVNDLE